MQCPDYAPSSSPTLRQQEDALQKGLGRARQWVRAGVMDRQALIAACLEDQRHDAQVEDLRGTWLWEMVRQSESENLLREPLLRALDQIEAEPRSALQRCELAGCFAALGDRDFHGRLYRIVEEKPLDDDPWLGEAQILQLDEAAALLFAAEQRGLRLVRGDSDWDWDDEVLVDEAIDLLGKDRVLQSLDASDNACVQAFFRRYLEETADAEENKDPDPSRVERAAAIEPEEVIQAARERTHRLSSGLSMRAWGMHVDDDALQSVWQSLRAEREPETLSVLLRVFSNRPLPQFDAHLIELCRHDDSDVQRAAFHALEKNRHTAIREFALEGLAGGWTHRPTAALFIRNYAPGDEIRILESMELPEDPNERHWLLMDVIKVLEHNEQADSSSLAMIAYALTPCETCRFDAVRCLDRQQVAPDWMVAECLDDSNEECREWAAARPTS